MSNSILDVFDASLQKTQLWLNDLMSELGWEEQPQKACLALDARRSTRCAIGYSPGSRPFGRTTT